jgi:hypothetical protein
VGIIWSEGTQSGGMEEKGKRGERNGGEGMSFICRGSLPRKVRTNDGQGKLFNLAFNVTATPTLTPTPDHEQTS